jgi:ribonuclease E
VSFFTEPQVDSETVPQKNSPPAATSEPATSTETPAPRRAGWWSRRFGGGE